MPSFVRQTPPFTAPANHTGVLPLGGTLTAIAAVADAQLSLSPGSVYVEGPRKRHAAAVPSLNALAHGRGDHEADESAATAASIELYLCRARRLCNLDKKLVADNQKGDRDTRAARSLDLALDRARPHTRVGRSE